jgi:hypothetical protein
LVFAPFLSLRSAGKSVILKMTHSTVSIVWARAAIAADLSLGTLRPHFLFSYLLIFIAGPSGGGWWEVVCVCVCLRFKLTIKQLRILYSHT